MSTADRIIRVIIAAVIGLLYFTDVLTGISGVILMVLAVIFLLTGIISFCPLYSLFGLRTSKVKEKD